MLVRKVLGEFPDYTCARNWKKHGDLELAQEDKRDFIIAELKLKKGNEVLDIGCGWGNMLNHFRKQAIKGYGVSLSSEQSRYCNRHGLEAKLMNWKDIDPRRFSKFGGIVSIGAFEHFCSIEDMVQGRQEEVYKDFFKLCYDLLEGKWVFLQTMVWGENVPWQRYPLTNDEFKKYANYNAEKGSVERHLGLLSAHFPGSWLPRDLAQIIECAQPYFKVVKTENGREDYIPTLRTWFDRLDAIPFWYRLPLHLRYLFGNVDQKTYVESMWERSIQWVFENKVSNHWRIVFEKV